MLFNYEVFGDNNRFVLPSDKSYFESIFMDRLDTSGNILDRSK